VKWENQGLKGCFWVRREKGKIEGNRDLRGRVEGWTAGRMDKWLNGSA